MAGYGQYPQYPHGYNPYYNVSPTSQPGVSPDGYMPNPQLLQSSSSDSLHAAYAVYDDGSQPILPAQAGQIRIRRRPVPNAEHVKHRRTRSGCYTCRSRRVKCDEAHPICERCRKGNRECVYPEPTQAGKSSRGGKGKSSTTGEASSDEEDDEQEGKEKLATIPDEGEDGSEDPQSGIQETLSPASHSNSQRDGSSPPSLTADKSPSPATEIPVLPPPKRPVITKRQSRQTLKSAAEAKPPEITPEIQFYLDYFRQNITHHHYAQKYDAHNFFTTEYLDIAVTNAPLLYAVVGFSAYHHTLQKPGGRLADFLGFYHMSIKCLRQSIERKQKHNVATLLAILQLANIEEVLGDWVNLMGHQRAAYEILTMLYTPQSIQKSNKLRRAFQWYMHFELFVALQSGYETVLGPEWSQEAYRYCVTQTQNRPDDLSAVYEERFACTQAIANEVAVLIARKTKGQITDEAFGAALAGLSQKISSYTTELDQRLVDPAYLVKDFSGAPPRDPDDIVDPYDENTLFGGDRWATNLIFIDIWSVELMFKSMMSAMMQQPPSEDLYQTAIKSAQLFEALELYPRAPPGTIIDAQASFGLATLFLPKDERTKTWCRRKFAKIETLGYIYPKGFRARMTQTWAVDVNFWWLPDEEGCPPIVRELRDFTDERSSMAKDQTSEDLRVLKNIFETMRMADTTTSRSKAPAYTYEGGSPEFVFGSEGSGEAILYEDSPPFKWDYGQDNTTPR